MGYTKYALGDSVLVVVGTLIALQINDWYLERLDRQTESENLVSMKRDLAEDARVREAMIAYEQGLETAQQRGRDVMTYFHGLEKSHKALFDLTLSKRAMEFIEQDYLNMLQPIGVFQQLVPAGNRLSGDDPLLIADSLSTLIEDNHGIWIQVETTIVETDQRPLEVNSGHSYSNPLKGWSRPEAACRISALILRRV